jgi:V8-like Glu-specific endopeptidase
LYPRFLSRIGAAVLLAGGLSACSAEPELLGREQSAILGGEQTGPAHAGVVYVSAEVATFSGLPVTKIGSGALVAPNLILTALHVVSRNRSDVPFTCDAMGNETSGSDGSLLGATVEAEKVAIHAGQVPGAEPVARGAKIISSGSPTLCKNDIAFVVLDTPVDLPAYRVHRGAKVEVGAPITVVGYGNEQVEPGMLPARTELAVTVTHVGQWIRTFTVSEGPCEGDSGGPALAEDGELVGVFSSVSSGCTGPSAAPKYTDVSYFESLVEEAFEAAEAGSPWSSGVGGEAPAEAGQPGTGVEAGAGGSSAGGSAPEPRARDDSGCSFQPRAQGSMRGLLGLILLGGCLLCRHVRWSRRACALR